MKILNLYAGIGGNRRLWGDEHEVTAVEIDRDIAGIYQDLYPNDKVLVGDAHEYLLQNFKNYDFIWSSPPCQTHGSIRQNLAVRYRGVKPAYPDMTLYEEIILLLHNAECLWAVENVSPYYEVLIRPTAILQRHLFWSNFIIRKKDFEQENLRAIQIPELQQLHGVDLSGYKLKNKRQVLRNCVGGDLGQHVLNEALAHTGESITLINQLELV